MTAWAPRLAAGLLVLGAVLALSTIVDRGWVPHDEGMIGQTAVRVMIGQRPHVDYHEPYTGGLAALHAEVFRLAGVDLLHLRWALFAVAAASLLLVYRLARRDVAPVGAAVAVWVALSLSYPHYFASVPSWWVLACALAAVWSLLRHIDTGSLRYAVLAGLWAGLALAIKQTGLYLVMAVGLVLLYRGGARLAPRAWAHPAGVVRALAAASAVGAAFALLASRPGLAEWLYLLLPVAAAAWPLLLSRADDTASAVEELLPAVAAGAAALVPVLALLVPYVAAGQTTDFLLGAFLAPVERLQFANWPLPSPWLYAVGVLLAGALVPWPRGEPGWTAGPVLIGRWLIAGGLLAGVAAVGTRAAWVLVVQLVWSGATLLPLYAAASLHARDDGDATALRRRMVVPTMLACVSLVQFPYAHYLYFCYVTPLVVLAGVGLIAGTRHQGMPLAVLLLGLGSFGVWHDRSHRVRETPLALGGASLTVPAQDAATYQEVMRIVGAHLGAHGRLVATPDCPEIYFLAGRQSPDGEIFEFLRWPHVRRDLPQSWATAEVVVINHAPDFSPRVPAEALASLARSHRGRARVAGFEIHWRE